MEEAFAQVVLSATIAVVVALVARSRGWGIALPLIAVGALVDWLPFGPDAPPEPEFVLVVILAPLVFGEALGSSYLDLRRVQKPVLVLAIGLVIGTTFAVGAVAGAGGVEGEGGWGPGIEDQVSSDGGRVALFARGPISDRAQLTVSLDTARERDRDRLFGPPEPDRFYTVYGDAAQRTDEAERQGPLYARVDLPSGFVQWGDFSSGFDRSELARYDRRLSGLSTRAQRGRLLMRRPARR